MTAFIIIGIIASMGYCLFKVRQTEDEAMRGVWVSLVWAWMSVLIMIIIWR